MTHTQYLNFINDIIKTDGWQVADKANKIALEKNEINLRQYSGAARIIADAFLNETEN